MYSLDGGLPNESYCIEKIENKWHLYFDEVNEVPVPYRWSYNLDDIDIEKENLSEIVYCKPAEPCNQVNVHRNPVPVRSENKRVRYKNETYD